MERFYALLALALIVVYTVTRVISCRRRVVSYAALVARNVAGGQGAGTVYLLLVAGAAVAVARRVAARPPEGPLGRADDLFVLETCSAPLLVAAAAWAAAARPD